MYLVWLLIRTRGSFPRLDIPQAASMFAHSELHGILRELSAAPMRLKKPFFCCSGPCSKRSSSSSWYSCLPWLSLSLSICEGEGWELSTAGSQSGGLGFGTLVRTLGSRCSCLMTSRRVKTPFSCCHPPRHRLRLHGGRVKGTGFFLMPYPRRAQGNTSTRG